MSNFLLSMIGLIIIGIYFLLLDFNAKATVKRNEEILSIICPPMIQNFLWIKNDNCAYMWASTEFDLIEPLKSGKIKLKSEEIIGNGYRTTDINRTYEIVEDEG